jgi:hypothetical protein
VPAQQLFVAALLDDPARVHDHDRVGVADGGQPGGWSPVSSPVKARSPASGSAIGGRA